MTRRQVTATAGLLVAGALAAGAWLTSGADPVPPPPAPRALPVEVARAERVETFVTTRLYTGEVAARRTSELGFDRGGRLVAVEVDAGARVAAGRVLARLDARRLEARRRELAAQRAQAAAQLELMLAGARQETIAAARAEVRALSEDLALARTRRERRDLLYVEDAISLEEREATFFGEAAAAARLDAAQRRLDELEAGTRAETIEAQRAALEALDASLEGLDVELDDTRLVAPWSGTVAARRADEGDVVAAGQPVLRLVEDGALEARVGLPLSAAAALDAGAPTQLAVGERDVAARVRAVLPELDGATRTATAVLDLDPEEAGRCFPGQTVKLEVSEEVELGPAGGVWVPTTALTKGSRGLWSVYVLEPAPDGSQRVGRRDVEVLHTRGDAALVRGTLRGGELVVESGVHRVVPDQLVRPIAPASPVRP